MRFELVSLALALAIDASGGCAWSHQRVHLRPTIPFARSDIAGGRSVVLRVEDERQRTEIGRRIGPGEGGAITSDQDLASLVRGAFADALERYGFRVASSGGTGEAALNIALRSLEYEAAREGISRSVHARAAVEARCRSGARGYENFYREHHTRPRRSFPLAPEANEALPNEMFSGVLRQPLADRAPLDCLAGAAGPAPAASDRSDQTP
ncbi:MAG TPA: YajG family lipoprotein [Myxococcota bacterium]|nr:YajG family lipoprotein [Myxococcota bacterium]